MTDLSDEKKRIIVTLNPSQISSQIDSEISESEMKSNEIFKTWTIKSHKEKIYSFLFFSYDFTAKSLPVAIIFLVYMLVFIMNILIISHTDKVNKKDILAGVGIGTTTYNMLGLSIGMGIASALDTFCTHSFGANQFYLMGCYLNRARIILSIVYIPIFFIILFLEPILLQINQDPDIAHITAVFCQGTLPGLFFFFQLEAQRRFMQAQGIYIKPVFCVMISTAIHPLWIYVFYIYLDWGAFGLGFTVSIANLSNFILLTCIAYRDSVEGSFFLVNSDSFIGWKEFLSLAIPSCLMSCLETWNYEIVTLMTGYLSNKDQIDANIILLNISSFFYMYPFGVNVASSNIIGKYVGKYNLRAVELLCKFVMIYSIILSTMAMLILFIFRNYIPPLFTEDKGITEILNSLIIYYIVYEFFDFITTSYGGIFRGLGLQNWIAWANLICFYIISIPLCYLFTYTFKYEIFGTRSSYILWLLFFWLLFIV